ncbi:hypothetical protein BGZ99_004690 [Dissophora globulifera]|uniref:Uncharacterized protein n=1 Tax=Dissophora globulifera TaxID=979702 RepID=A0A9P6RLB2_9FUNG|nr:hypothetical protein BGZ99_004690 [Dissophora globulifera]
MSEHVFPLKDDDWITNRPTPKLQQQQQRQQQQQQQQQYQQQQQLTLRQSRQQQPHRQQTLFSHRTTTTSSFSLGRSSLDRPRRYSDNNYGGNFSTCSTFSFKQQQQPSRVFDIETLYSQRHSGISGNGSGSGSRSYNVESSRLERLPLGTGRPEGVWNAFSSRYTQQDWHDWTNDPQNLTPSKWDITARRLIAPRAEVTTETARAGAETARAAATVTARAATGTPRVATGTLRAATPPTRASTAPAKATTAPRTPEMTPPAALAATSPSSATSSFSPPSSSSSSSPAQSFHRDSVEEVSRNQSSTTPRIQSNDLDSSTTPTLISFETSESTESTTMSSIKLVEEHGLLDLNFDTVITSQPPVPAVLEDLLDLDFSAAASSDTSMLIDLSDSGALLSSISAPSSANSTLIDSMSSTHSMTDLLGILDDSLDSTISQKTMIPGESHYNRHVSTNKIPDSGEKIGAVDLLSFLDAPVQESAASTDALTTSSIVSDNSQDDDDDDDDDSDRDTDYENDSDDSDAMSDTKSDLWRVTGDNQIVMDLEALERVRADLERIGVTWEQLTQVRL